MLSFEEKIRKAEERKEERSSDLQRKYDLAKSMYKNIYDADLEFFERRINDPVWTNDPRTKAANEIIEKFKKAEKENQKLYDQEIKEAKEEEKEELTDLLEDLTVDWYWEDDEKDWFDEDEEDDEELEAI